MVSELKVFTKKSANGEIMLATPQAGCIARRAGTGEGYDDPEATRTQSCNILQTYLDNKMIYCLPKQSVDVGG